MTDRRSAVEIGTSDPAGKLVARRVTVEPYGIVLGPLGHMAEERQRLAKPSFEHIEVVPRGTTLGAEIRGVDLRTALSDEVIDEIRRALRDYKVIYFRDQPISPEDHIRFAGRFGELEIHPFIGPNPEHPELVRFEKSADTGGFENGWHHDVTWRETPSMGAVLHAILVPSTGGDTLFSDVCAAYDGLDDATKERISDLYAIHDFMLAFSRQVPPDRMEATRAKFPPARHPVVRTHPDTGRKLIYVNRYFTSHIEGLSTQESVDLVNELAGRAEIAEYQFRLVWEPHTVAFWDNIAVQHYASSDYWPDARIMERASIAGTRPV